MATGKRRIAVGRKRGSLWARLRGQAAAPPSATVEGVDYTLRRRAATRSVRAFVEAIDTYQLHTRRTVHVVSHYRIPTDAGLQEQIPEWIAQRVRFGISGPDGEAQYVPIRHVDIVWDEDGTELYLHLEERILPGTRAFIAAYLGEGVATADDEPPTLLLGAP
jgi:hypothetical protein